jgi:hypothetical protein
LKYFPRQLEQGLLDLLIIIVEQSEDGGGSSSSGGVQEGDQVLLGVGGGWEAAEVVAGALACIKSIVK